MRFLSSDLAGIHWRALIVGLQDRSRQSKAEERGSHGNGGTGKKGECRPAAIQHETKNEVRKSRPESGAGNIDEGLG